MLRFFRILVAACGLALLLPAAAQAQDEAPAAPPAEQEEFALDEAPAAPVEISPETAAVLAQMDEVIKALDS